MNFTQYIEIALGGITGLAALAFGTGYMISQFSQGRNKERSDKVQTDNQLIQFWKDQVQGFKDMISEQNNKLALQAKDYDSKLQTLSNELSVVKGQLMEKEKQNKEYLSILQNRNPETEQFMQKLTQDSMDQNDYRKESKEMFQQMIKVLTDIHTASTDNNAMLKEDNKNLHIEATVSKE